MKKISILGCGWLGMQIAELLISNGYDVTGSRTAELGTEELRKKGIKSQLLVLKNKESIQEIPLFFETDILIISLTPSSFSHKYRYHEAIADVVNMLKSEVKVILISSTSVYADDNEEKFENSKRMGFSSNSVSIIQAEDVLLNQSKNKFCIIRPAGLIGKSRYPGKFFAGRKNIANGLAPVNLVTGEDVCQILYQLIIQQKWNEVFNACSPNHPIKMEFYSKAATLAGLEKPDFKSEKVSFKLINGEKASDVLSFTYQHADLMGWLETQIKE